MVKVCSVCNKEKSIDEFYRQSRIKNGRTSACKICLRGAYTNSRNKKKEHYNNIRKVRGDLNKQKYEQWKDQQKCYVCPEDDIDCLDLHHLDPNEKDVNISDVVRYWSWERLQTEINKCVVICSCCHRKVHRGKLMLFGV